MPANHPSITAWVTKSPETNVLPPLHFTIGRDPWPGIAVDGVFTANTTHIMQRDEVRLMMELVAANLPRGGIFCQYGPMNVNGQYTSESNRKFDETLKNDGYGGIRSVEQLEKWGRGLQLVAKVPMPTNNFLLVCRSSR